MKSAVDVEALAEGVGPVPQTKRRANQCLARELDQHLADGRLADAPAATQQDATVRNDDHTQRVTRDDDPNRDEGEVLADRLGRDDDLNFLAWLQ